MTTDNEKQAAALAILAAAKEKTDRLHAAYNGLDAKISQYAANTQTALESAKTAEQQAAADLATAIAEGADTDGITKAEQKLAASTEKARLAAQANSDSAVIDSLKTQQAALHEQLEAAQREQQRVQWEVDGFRREALQAAWDTAVNALLDIGAELIQVLPQNGFYHTKDMWIPTMRDGLRRYSRDDLLTRTNNNPAEVHLATLPPLTPRASSEPKGKTATEGRDVLDYGNEGDAPTESVSGRPVAPRASMERTNQYSVRGTGRTIKRTR